MIPPARAILVVSHVPLELSADNNSVSACQPACFLRRSRVAVADADRLVLGRVEVTSLGEGRVAGAAYGERYDHTRPIKVVTYHKFFVKQLPSGWVAEVFLDV